MPKKPEKNAKEKNVKKTAKNEVAKKCQKLQKKMAKKNHGIIYFCDLYNYVFI